MASVNPETWLTTADPQSKLNPPIDVNVNESGPRESAFTALVKQGPPDQVGKETNMRWIINLSREWVRRPRVATASQAHAIIDVKLDEDKVILDDEWEMLFAIDNEGAREHYLRCRFSRYRTVGIISGGPFHLACADSTQLEALLKACSVSLLRDVAH